MFLYGYGRNKVLIECIRTIGLWSCVMKVICAALLDVAVQLQYEVLGVARNGLHCSSGC
jgi:hypothetical protein